MNRCGRGRGRTIFSSPESQAALRSGCKVRRLPRHRRVSGRGGGSKKRDPRACWRTAAGVRATPADPKTDGRPPRRQWPDSARALAPKGLGVAPKVSGVAPKISGGAAPQDRALPRELLGNRERLRAPARVSRRGDAQEGQRGRNVGRLCKVGDCVKSLAPWPCLRGRGRPRSPPSQQLRSSGAAAPSCPRASGMARELQVRLVKPFSHKVQKSRRRTPESVAAHA